jgi:hypothetical protein
MVEDRFHWYPLPIVCMCLVQKQHVTALQQKLNSDSMKSWAMWGPGYSGPVAIWVGYAPGAGRGVFAVRDIAVGDLIHTAHLVVAHPALASLQKVRSTSSP